MTSSSRINERNRLRYAENAIRTPFPGEIEREDSCSNIRIRKAFFMRKKKEYNENNLILPLMKKLSVLLSILLTLPILFGCTVSTKDGAVSVNKDKVSVSSGENEVDISKDEVNIKTKDGSVALNSDDLTAISGEDEEIIMMYVGEDESGQGESLLDPIEGEASGDGAVPENAKCEAQYQEAVAANADDYSDCYANPDYGDCSGEFSGKTINLVLIMDSSGSMGLSVGGEKKIEIAKTAAETFVNTLKDTVNLGLIVYGHKGSNSSADKPVSCAGIEEAYPLSPVNSEGIAGTIRSLQPTGWTPIAGALEKAESILTPYPSTEYANRIVLVSDGEETCGGIPAPIASRINTSGISGKVNVIGFDVYGAEEEQLKSIAESGGGVYSPARSEKELIAALSRQQELLCMASEKRDWAGDMRFMAECKRRLAAEQRGVAAYIREAEVSCRSYIQDRYKEREASMEAQMDEMQEILKAAEPSAGE